MNYAEVVKSFQHFFEDIIPKARCSPSWDEKSIATAFLWANFCEQIYDKFSEDTETVENLDNQIHQLTYNHLGVSRCFKSLQQSNKFLYQSFLQNPSIQKNFLQDLVLKANPSKLNFVEASLEVYELDNLCLELFESLRCITLPDSDQSFYSDIKTKLFLDFLKDTIVHLSTEKQYESHLSFVFDTLSKSQENLAITLHVLLSDADSEIVVEIQDFALNWILFKLVNDKNCSLANFLWKHPPLQLRKIAAKFPSFCNYYTDYLINCAASLSPEYENLTKCWKKRVLINEITLEYKDIIEHFEALLCVEDELCKSIRKLLSSLLDHEPKTSVWHDICPHILS